MFSSLGVLKDEENTEGMKKTKMEGEGSAAKGDMPQRVVGRLLH
jgi:hypothetical protein